MVLATTRFLLCRNSRPFADWLMIVNGATTHLVSFEEDGEKQVRIHNMIELNHEEAVKGFEETGEAQVRHITLELKRLAKMPML